MKINKFFFADMLHNTDIVVAYIVAY